MALNLSKTYTPASGEVADSSGYNTDMSTVFNAFIGLEDQSSTLNALTITPTANSTTIFRVNNAAGTELISADTTNSYFKIKATGRIYLDGGSNTYIVESGADQIDIYTGGTLALEILSTQDVALQATKKLYLDGGGNTYIHESAGDNLEIVVAGAIAFTCLGSNDVAIEATGKLYFDGGDDTYMDEGSGNKVGFVAAATAVFNYQAGGVYPGADDTFVLGDTDFYWNGLWYATGGLNQKPSFKTLKKDVKFAKPKKMYDGLPKFGTFKWKDDEDNAPEKKGFIIDDDEVNKADYEYIVNDSLRLDILVAQQSECIRDLNERLVALGG
jgi:hypothetical protein